MIIKSKLKKKIFTTTIFLMILLTSFYTLNFIADSTNNSGKLVNTSDINEEKNFINERELPETSIIGQDTWWNDYFNYRCLINITNPQSSTLTNFLTSIVFNYSKLVLESKIQNSLNDVRIVKNGILQKYYIKKDYNNTKPQTGLATAYFRVNISGYTTYTDTYLYYGNSTCSQATGYNLGNCFGLLDRWDFEDGPGSSTVKDTTGSNNGQLQNMNPSSDYVNGKIGKYALDFDGSNDFVKVPDNPSLDVTRALSISFWAYRTRNDRWMLMVGNGGGWEQNGYHIMSYSGSYGYRFEIQNRTETVKKDIVDLSYAIPNNQWHLWTAVYDGSEVKLYLDDTARYTDNTLAVSYIAASNKDLHFGWHDYGPSYYQGILDDVRIYNYKLTVDEINWIYNRYNLSTILNEEEGKRAQVKVIAKDLYDNLLANVNISLYNKTTSKFLPVKSGISGEDGSYTFSNLQIGEYNFSVFMSSDVSNKDYTVKINETKEPVYLQGLSSVITLKCNASTNLLYIKDCNNNPVESGYVLVGNDNFGTIRNCSIDISGKATFFWLNITPYDYNYTIRYQNSIYLPNDIVLGTGDINQPDQSYVVNTELTTINFTVKAQDDPYNVVDGAKLNITRADDKTAIVNLTTDENGKATLRWLNSTGLGSDYELRIFHWIDRMLNTSTGSPADTYKCNFPAGKATNYEFRINTNPDNFKTQIIWLNPSENIEIEWGTIINVRALLNVTKAGEPPLLPLEPTYADSMTYEVIKGTATVVLSGIMERELDYIGRHQGTIDTTNLESQMSYNIRISAQKSGFSTPTPLLIPLRLLDVEIEIIEKDTAELEKSPYWMEPGIITVEPYSKSTENFIIDDNIFTQSGANAYNFKVSIPEINSDWNFTQIKFDIYNITWSVGESIANFTFIDPNGKYYMWHKNNATLLESDLDYSGGSWKDITINLCNLQNSDSFQFTIGGSFTGNIDITAETIFTRDNLNLRYLRFNITNSMGFYSDEFLGWAMENVTFQIYNCRYTSNWLPVDLSNTNALNITTNEGFKYQISGGSNGVGVITIDDRIIYPIDDNFLFAIENNTNIMFDVIIDVEFIQNFYWNSFVDLLNMTLIETNFVGGIFTVPFEKPDWSDTGILFTVENLKNASGDFISPTEAGLNITIAGILYDIGEYGTILLTSLSKDFVLNGIIQSNQIVTFTLNFKIEYSRLATRFIYGTIRYEISDSDKEGNVEFIPYLDYYRVIIDTNDLIAEDYNVIFSLNKPNYDDEYDTGDEIKLNVIERITSINGLNADYPSAYNIYVTDTLNFYFSYTDTVLNIVLTELSVSYYNWYLLGAGNVILDQGQGDLILGADNRYILDFDTETRSVGTYYLIAKLQKDNYQLRTPTISLTIDLRPIDYELGSEFEDKQASVVKGKKIVLSIKLIDDASGSPISGANVVLEIGDDEFKFEEVEPGLYEFKFDSEDYEAYFTSNTLSGTIKITKTNYVTEEIDITIIIQMEEISPGIPTFYFVLAISAISAIASALVAYKAIQIARIPKFVKKVRAMKKAIKIKKEISESLLTDTKEEIILKQFEDNWNRIGLSLKDILGVKEKEVIHSEGKKLLTKNKGGGA